MILNLKGQIEIIKAMDLNFSELSRIYDMDRRTVKNITKVMKENLKLEIS